jgi:putative PIN family toxin of toxin-antitoxin system
MTDAILDTNVYLQASFRSPQSASHRVLRAHEHGKFRLVFSEETIDELLDVLSLPRMRERLGWSDDEILDFVLSNLADALVHIEVPKISHDIARDITDTKFLALSELSGAEYLVTYDHRHLLPLKQFGRTRIVTPAQFLRELDRVNHARSNY